MNEEVIYWIWLSQVKGIGPNTAGKLLTQYKSPKIIYEMVQNGLDLTNQISVRQLQNMRQSLNLDEAKKIMDECDRNKITVMTKISNEYPNLARSIADMPIVFYYRGKPAINRYENTAGVVGARRCTYEEKQKAIDIVSQLVEKKIPIISGMAKGIDSYAHTAALKNYGYTIAVLGHGLDYCYPIEHHLLMERISEAGMVVSEYPPGITPKQYYFPRRNRIISALSSKLYVIGTGKNSGTRSTVEYSKKYSREVCFIKNGS